MYYKDFRITAVYNVKERQDVDEKGETTYFLDSWIAGDAVYEAVSRKDASVYFTSDSFEGIKRLVDLANGEL